MSTFHTFLRLPKELRDQIWEATVERVCIAYKQNKVSIYAGALIFV
jgi:hypothetical protein